MYENSDKLQDERFIAGETMNINFYFKSKHTGLSVDLQEFTAKLLVCQLGERENKLLEKKGDVSIIERGKVSFVLSGTDTQGWQEGHYEFNVILTSKTGVIRKARGVWFIKGGVL